MEKNEKARVINRYLSRLEEIGMKLEIDPADFMAYLERKNATKDQMARLTEIRQAKMNEAVYKKLK